MRFEPRLDPPKHPAPLAARLGWMVLFWAGGVAALGAIGLVLRAWLGG